MRSDLNEAISSSFAMASAGRSRNCTARLLFVRILAFTCTMHAEQRSSLAARLRARIVQRQVENAARICIRCGTRLRHANKVCVAHKERRAGVQLRWKIGVHAASLAGCLLEVTAARPPAPQRRRMSERSASLALPARQRVRHPPGPRPWGRASAA